MAAIMLAAALTVGAAARVSAQRLPPGRFAAQRPLRATSTRDDSAHVNAANLAIGGVAGGIVGGLGGAWAGYYLGGGNRSCGDDSCGVFGLVLGFALGEPIGVGAGVNLADRGRGNALLDVLGAAGVGYFGLLAGGETTSGALLAATAAVQLGVTVAIERATAH